MPAGAGTLCAVLLEVCSGCDLASRTGRWGSLLCCAALSVQGLSVLLQVRTICPPEMTLRPLYRVRMLHLPLSLALFYLLLPVSLAVLTVARAVPLLRGRNGPDKTAACGVCMLLAFALSAAVFDVFADSAAQLLFWASAGLLSAAAENGRAVSRQPEI